MQTRKDKTPGYPRDRCRAATARERWLRSIDKRLHQGAFSRYALLTLAAAACCTAEPLRLLPANPHYFEYRGRPTILITSGEHYGAVLNLDFDYKKYLGTLAADHLNLTRTFSGEYREVAGNFHIEGNTLAPKPDRYAAPWARSEKPGAADGLNKFDLTRWNDAYFARLRDFVREAAAHGIIVEMNLFCPFYEDSMWEVNPLNAHNNVNGIGDVKRTEVYNLSDPDLTRTQVELTRKIVSELADFDNLYYEICNEPYFGGVTLEWQRKIADAITDADRRRPHLISQNIANYHQQIADPDPRVSIFNFHYARPPVAVTENYGLSKVIGNNETGFDGTADNVYRIQAWDFMMAGGALFNNLDYSFTVGSEDGTAKVTAPTPGGGGVAFRKQMRILKDWFEALPFAWMHPATDLFSSETGELRALADPGVCYAVYIHHATVRKLEPHIQIDRTRKRTELRANLPEGAYRVNWFDPRTGRELTRSTEKISGKEWKLLSPEYDEDVAVVIRK